MDREENMRGMAEAEASALDELITRRLEPVLRRLDAIESRLGQQLATRHDSLEQRFNRLEGH